MSIVDELRSAYLQGQNVAIPIRVLFDAACRIDAHETAIKNAAALLVDAKDGSPERDALDHLNAALAAPDASAGLVAA